MMIYIPNRFPKITNSQYRIALIGEAPGQDEVSQGEPFVGASGRMLKGVLSQMGIQPDACFFGNVCQVRPLNNDIELFQWQGEEIQHGLAQLTKDFQEFQPWLVVLLGKTALYAASHRVDIGNQRGSLFTCTLIGSPMLGRKCMSTYHPAACLRTYEWVPIFKFDIKRAADEGKTHFLSLPERDIKILKTVPDVEQWLDLCRHHTTGTDIEGYVYDMQCLALAPDPFRAGVIPFKGPNDDSFWSEDDEIIIWLLVAAYMEDPLAIKVWQNGLYDRFIFQYTYKIVVRGNAHDTMLEWHEWNPELPKGLDTQSSILTREPYYKHERKSDSWDTKLIYGGKDSCVTLEGHQQLTKRLNETSRTHYHFNRDLLNPLLYMELRGMAYKTEEAKQRRQSVLYEMYEAQHLLDQETGMGYKKTDSILCVQEIKSLMCYVRDKSTPKASHRDVYPRAMELAQKEDPLTTIEQAELSSLLERQCNVDSPKFTKYLYETLKLPTQFNKQTKRPTANYEALLILYKKTQSKVCELAINIRDKSTRAGMLAIHADGDGRIRCAYNSVGTNTGRLTSYSSPTGSGYNLQTIPQKDRDLFVADTERHFFQCDLSGADGWTVAAHAKHLGDPTMYDDYIYGLKPAKILCLLLRHGAGTNQKSREELKDLSKTVEKESWDYFACKIGQHGSSYLMGEKTMRDHIFIQSEGKLLLTDKEVHDLQTLFFIRYHGIKQWHQAIQRRLAKSPVLTSASGLTRRFFGRTDQILGEALSFEPQSNTTYATNKAMLNLWNDPSNRVTYVPETIQHVERTEGVDSNGVDTSNMLCDGSYGRHKILGNSPTRLRIEPLHQVHDAVCGQFKKSDTAWAIGKIKSYFNNTLTIANQSIIIPFEGGYGPSWGELGEKYGGGSI